MKSLFLKVKPSSVLLLLKDSQQQWYPSKLARASNSSYVHTVNLLLSLRKLGIVVVEKKGKQNLYKLTEKGAYLALSLEEFAKRCDAAEQEQKSAAAKAESDRQAQEQASAGQQKAEKPSEAEKK